MISLGHILGSERAAILALRCVSMYSNGTWALCDVRPGLHMLISKVISTLEAGEGIG